MNRHQFNLKQFYKFCQQLKIESKEQGMITLGDTLLGSQTYVMDEVAKGLDDGVHFFIVLKGRQLGITTISLALDLYWHFLHPGMQGTLTTDTEENREQFRSTLQMYMDGLPKEYKIPLLSHNRNQLVLKNRSRLFYQVAGLRAKGSLGRGKGITFLHGTETSSWGDEEGLASLLASLAETNPLRYYMFESTARGFNMFHDMWVTAKRAKTQKAIFCGWWRNQFYSADPNSNIYKVYWDGKLNSEKRMGERDQENIRSGDQLTPDSLVAMENARRSERREPHVSGVPAHGRLCFHHDGNIFFLYGSMYGRCESCKEECTGSLQIRFWVEL